jgi:muconate cycloisomerase
MDAPIGRHAIVRLDTDDDTSGWGESPAIATWGGAQMRQYGETPETVKHIVEDYLLPAVRDLDPAEISVIHARMDRAVKGHPYAKAAVDIACHDLAGKAQGVPVSTLLGGRHRGAVEIAHSLGIMPIEPALDEAVHAVSEGVRTIKCKTGLEPDRDVELVARLRERLGENVLIRVDANEGYRSVSQAVEVIRRQQEHGITLCEQPVPGADALARVARRVNVPVMADESAWTVIDILELYRLEAAECFSCYVTKPGGFYRARQQAELAAELGMSCDIGGSIELGIGTAANLHLAAALPNAVIPSVCAATRLEGRDEPAVAGVYYVDDVIVDPLQLRDGRLVVPDGPGLGIDVDIAKLRRYAV